MSSYQAPPKIPQTPSREEQNANQEAFLSFWNIFHDKSKAFADWLVGFIPWVDNLHSEVTSYRNDALNAKNRAITAEYNAVGAWNDIQGYTVPVGTALSVDESEEREMALLEAIMNNTLYNLNNNKGYNNDD